MGKKLYVGNLNYDVDSSALEMLFKAHGTVESAAVMAEAGIDRQLWRSILVRRPAIEGGQDLE